MTSTELIQMYFERSNALQWYWTLYVVIIGGLLAFASMRKQPDLVTTLLVTVLYCFFAYKNLGAIVDVSLQRLAVHGEITKIHKPGEPGGTIVATLDPSAVDGIKQFHWASDGLTVLALWSMELRRRKFAKSSPSA